MASVSRSQLAASSFSCFRPLASEAIELRLATGVRHLPVRGQQPAVFEPVQGGIERALRHLHDVARDQLKALRDAVAVNGPARRRLAGSAGRACPGGDRIACRHHTPRSSTYTALHVEAQGVGWSARRSPSESREATAEREPRRKRTAERSSETSRAADRIHERRDEERGAQDGRCRQRQRPQVPNLTAAHHHRHHLAPRDDERPLPIRRWERNPMRPRRRRRSADRGPELGAVPRFPPSAERVDAELQDDARHDGQTDGDGFLEHDQHMAQRYPG